MNPIEVLERRRLLSAALVKDINLEPSRDYAPFEIAAAGGVGYFAHHDGTAGLELWKSDGTAGGTTLVKDIRPGRGDSSPAGFTNVNGVVFFVADDGASGPELWKTDGTAAGTVSVKDIKPGPGGSAPSRLAAVGGELYFFADDGTAGRELWKSDGTEAGTVLVKDVRPGAPGQPVDGYSIARSADGDVFFIATTNGSNSELWKTDGTAAGTISLKALSTSPSFSTPTGSDPDGFVVVGSSLYFVAADAASFGRRIWKSDGTANGTAVLNIAAQPFIGPAANLTEFKGLLYFSASASGGEELWKSDGTAAGTVLVKDIVPGSGGVRPRELTPLGATCISAGSPGAFGGPTARPPAPSA